MKDSGRFTCFAEKHVPNMCVTELRIFSRDPVFNVEFKRGTPFLTGGHIVEYQASCVTSLALPNLNLTASQTI